MIKEFTLPTNLVVGTTKLFVSDKLQLEVISRSGAFSVCTLSPTELFTKQDMDANPQFKNYFDLEDITKTKKRKRKVKVEPETESKAPPKLPTLNLSSMSLTTTFKGI